MFVYFSVTDKRRNSKSSVDTILVCTDSSPWQTLPSKAPLAIVDSLWFHSPRASPTSLKCTFMMKPDTEVGFQIKSSHRQSKSSRCSFKTPKLQFALLKTACLGTYSTVFKEFLNHQII